MSFTDQRLECKKGARAASAFALEGEARLARRGTGVGWYGGERMFPSAAPARRSFCPYALAVPIGANPERPGAHCVAVAAKATASATLPYPRYRPWVQKEALAFRNAPCSRPDRLSRPNLQMAGSAHAGAHRMLFAPANIHRRALLAPRVIRQVAQGRRRAKAAGAPSADVIQPQSGKQAS